MALKSVYGTKHVQQCWNERVSKWKYADWYVNINAEKTVIKKSEPNGEFITHGLFVDDMLHLPSDPRLIVSSLPSTTRSSRQLVGWIR